MSDAPRLLAEGAAAPLSRDARAALVLAGAARELLELGRIDLARTAAELSLATGVAQPNCHSVMAGVLEEHGEWDAALGQWRAAARLAPGSPGHRNNLALALMLHGRWDEAAALHEARLDKPDWTSLAAKGSLDGIRFRLARPGDELVGRRVLAFTEQGLGDCVWAARWLPVLAARGVAVTVATRPELAPLLARIAPDLPQIGPPPEQPEAKINLAALAGRFDLFAPLMSLPNLLGVAAPTGDGVPYLAPELARIDVWRARYAQALPGRRPIGVVWRASLTNASSPRRSVPAAVLAALAACPDLGFVNLQGGPPEGREALAGVLPQTFDALADGEPPLDEFAAAVAATDTLVTVDTLAAHIAGAMGHKALVLVPAAPHFYWGLGRDVCPWYPTLRLFRQSRQGGWEAVVPALARALRPGGS